MFSHINNKLLDYIWLATELINNLFLREDYV